MKHSNPALFFIAILSSVSIFFSACKKLNEATELGGDLIPAVDNIHTFETSLDVIADNRLFNDSTKVYFSDNVAIGNISNDPEFGATHADAYFNISSTFYPFYPFYNKDSISIDSVVLSLSYARFYGDSNTSQTLHVYEIAQNSGFYDTSLYKYNQSDFLTTGPELGFKTFQARNLKDSIPLVFGHDTTRVTNVLRIPLSPSLGTRLASYDTTSGPNGAYRNDSVFRTFFRGLAIKADNSGNCLTFFSPSNQTDTKLIVYFKLTKNGVLDTISAEFRHNSQGQANIIRRTNSGAYASYLANGLPNDDKIYLQTVPGSYASIKIPGLDTFKNAVIHRAELLITPLRSGQDGIFLQPGALFLDRLSSAADTAFTFDVDMNVQPSGASFTYDFATFGGLLKSDSTYRFNISRYVQDIITLKYPNQTLRLYAPVRAFVFSKRFNFNSQMYITNQPADGRVVLAGGNYADLAKRMRLRIIYSKL